MSADGTIDDVHPLLARFGVRPGPDAYHNQRGWVPDRGGPPDRETGCVLSNAIQWSHNEQWGIWDAGVIGLIAGRLLDVSGIGEKVGWDDGDVIRTLRAIGLAIRPWCPEAADILESCGSDKPTGGP